jgi:hypothetical protein
MERNIELLHYDFALHVMIASEWPIVMIVTAYLRIASFNEIKLLLEEADIILQLENNPSIQRWELPDDKESLFRPSPPGKNTVAEILPGMVEQLVLRNIEILSGDV